MMVPLNKAIVIRDNAKRFLSSVAALLVLVWFSSTFFSAYGAESDWERYYTSIESEDALRYIAVAHKESVRLFGPPVINVRKVNLRLSRSRSPLGLMARADVTDWKRLSYSILEGSGSALELVRKELSNEAQNSLRQEAAGTPMPFSGEVAVIEALNSVIEKNSLAKNSGPVGFLKKLIKSDENATRLILDRQLSGAVLPIPKSKGKKLSKGFQLCEVTDSSKNIFTIYVSDPSTDDTFYLQLGHEANHLLNPYVFDWYMEGLCNCFAEHMAENSEKSFKPWLRRFTSRRHSDPYAIAYFMMKEIWAVAGTNMNTFNRAAVWKDSSKKQMRIDIDTWLSSLSPDMAREITLIISRYASVLDKNKGDKNSFTLPSSLRR